jgi:membrane dipeptidase
MMAHLVYLADLIGPEHLCLGIDNVYFLEQHYRTVARHPDRWPKGYPPPPWHYFAPEQVPALSEALLQHGFSEVAVKGILGENFLRVAELVWK